MNPPGIDRPTHPPEADADLAAVVSGRDTSDAAHALELVARQDAAMRQSGSHASARLDDFIAAGRPMFPEAAVAACATYDTPPEAHVRIDRVADRLESVEYSYVEREDVDELRAIAHDLRMYAANPRVVMAWDTARGHVATVDGAGVPEPHPTPGDAAHGHTDGVGTPLRGASS